MSFGSRAWRRAARMHDSEAAAPERAKRGRQAARLDAPNACAFPPIGVAFLKAFGEHHQEPYRSRQAVRKLPEVADDEFRLVGRVFVRPPMTIDEGGLHSGGLGADAIEGV